MVFTCHLPRSAALFAALAAFAILAPVRWCTAQNGPKTGLIGHWKLEGDVKDYSGNELHGVNHGVDLTAAGPKGKRNGAAGFNGRDAFIEISHHQKLNLGTGDFSLAATVHTEEKLDDVLGDILSKYDRRARRGINWSLLNFAGVVSAQSNYRQVFFGIDAGQIDSQWMESGRPGNNMFVFALCVYHGDLYAGTFEMEKDGAGHVFRYAGDDKWVDCGTPDRCNAVQALAVFDGKLYAGVGRYLSRGSALPPSPNEHPGGRVYRYEGDSKWVDCGKLGNPEFGESFTVGGLAVYQGKLYAGVSKPAGRGFYRYEGNQKWSYLGHPGNRVTNPVVYNGKLYLASLDGGAIARFDGPHQWTKVGKPEGISQTYGFAVYRGKLYSSTWPNGEVFRYDGGQNWASVGRLGEEKEVMGMAVYNGKLFGGTLPLAQVYRYEGGNRWALTGQLDKTPDVRYRRAWSMAIYQGKLYCGTLPSGKVFSLEAGKSVTSDRALAAGWRRLAVVKQQGRLRLYIDGKLAATSPSFLSAKYDLSNDQPLRIGFGEHDYFNGRMRDVRLYNRALTDDEVADLR